MIQVYTDGGFRGGRAGWGFIALSPAGEVVYTNAGELTAPPLTSQRAELYAAVAALVEIPHLETLEIVSDSQYLVKGMNDWVYNWSMNGWRTSQRRPVENRDLWERLLNLTGGRTSTKWRWIGRSSVVWNTQVDALVQEVLCTPLRKS